MSKSEALNRGATWAAKPLIQIFAAIYHNKYEAIRMSGLRAASSVSKERGVFVDPLMLLILVSLTLAVGAIVISVMLYFNFRRTKKIDLIQGKLQGSDESITGAVKHLKITNEWDYNNI